MSVVPGRVLQPSARTRSITTAAALAILLAVATVAVGAGGPASMWALLLACPLGAVGVVALARASFGSPRARALAFGAGLCVAAEPVVFAAASFSDLAPWRVGASMLAAWWHVPVLALADLALLASASRIVAPRAPVATTLVLAPASAAFAVGVLAGPPTAAGADWFIAPESPLGAALHALFSPVAWCWTLSLLVAPTALWMRARRAAGERRSRLVMLAVSSTGLRMIAVVFGVLVAVAVLSDLDLDLAYPIMSLGTPAAVLGSLLMASSANRERVGRRVRRRFGHLLDACVVAAAALAALVLGAVVQTLGPAWLALAASTAAAAPALLLLRPVRRLAKAWLGADDSSAGTANTGEVVAPQATGRAEPTTLAEPTANAASEAAVRDDERSVGDLLSARERDVIELLSRGMSNAGIARALHISPRTVDSHVSSVFAKLDVRHGPDENPRVQAASAWLSRHSQ